jgi:hypothetical protein
MPEPDRTFHVEAIVVLDAHTDPQLATPDDIRREVVSHFEYLGASVPLVAVRLADDDKGAGVMTLFENYTRLAAAIRERIELKALENRKVLPVSEVDPLVRDLIKRLEIEIAHNLQGRPDQREGAQ